MKRLYSILLRHGVTVLACAALSGNGNAQDVPEPASASTNTAVSTPGEYLIGPGDTLQVFVWGQPDLSVTVPVRPDGRVSTPLVEDLEAVGKTPTQLAREMEHVLAEYIRSPEVNVIVQKFVGTFANQIRVLGQAAQPRSVPYRERMTLLDVVIEVGGLTKYAAGNRSRVVRTVDGKRKEFRVRLEDLVNRGKIEQNLVMQPGDIVIIPEAVF
jgi:polysaccharide export outer membrane protein